MLEIPSPCHATICTSSGVGNLRKDGWAGNCIVLQKPLMAAEAAKAARAAKAAKAARAAMTAKAAKAARAAIPARAGRAAKRL